MRRWTTTTLLGLLILSLLAVGTPAPAQARLADATATSDLPAAFAAAAQEFAVPEPLLLAVSYNLTRWETHAGHPSTSGGYGPLHLTDLRSTAAPGGRGAGPLPSVEMEPLNTLSLAASLTGLDAATLRTDSRANVRGGAAVLAEYARRISHDAPPADADWYAAVALYSGWNDREQAAAFADAVYATLERGETHTTSDGATLRLAPQPVTPDRSKIATLGLLEPTGSTAECPVTLDCDFIAAAYASNDGTADNYGNYDLANRSQDGLPVRYIIIHDTEGSYTGTIQHFQNPLAKASAHYVLRSSDGHVTQMVENRNVTWHSGNWFVNAQAIGLEHEGVAIEGADWYTESLYQASARLTAFLCVQYTIPCNRGHILGHDEVPGPLPANQPGMHWDPGPFWDWDHYMDLVNPTPAPEASPLDVVEISPDFATNQPPLTYCYAANDCQDVPAQGANFVYVYSAPSFDAALVTNPYIGSPPTRASNWANKVVTGQRFYRLKRQGDWDAINFSGQIGWIYNPATAPVAHATGGTVLTPKWGADTIPVYGRAYPEAAAYPSGVPVQAITKIYDMPTDQRYVASELMDGIYYRSPIYTPTLDPSLQFPVIGELEYYQVWFNHRVGFVKAEDVDLLSERLLAWPQLATRSGMAGTDVSYTVAFTNTGTTTATLAYTTTDSLWLSDVSALSGTLTLAPGATTAITWTFTIPSGATSADSDDLRIKAWFADEPERSTTTHVTVLVTQPDLFIPLLWR